MPSLHGCHSCSNGLCLWFSAFNFHIISYDIKAIFPQVHRTQAIFSSPDSIFSLPLGPGPMAFHFSLNSTWGSMGKQWRWGGRGGRLTSMATSCFPCVKVTYECRLQR